MLDDTHASLPQDDWEPPGGDLDFEDIFGHAGEVNGSSTDLGQESTAQQPQTEVEEQPVSESVTPAAKPQVEAEKPFQFKTRTGTVYNSLEDLQRGVETKDETIARLRNALTAVTGEDPLKKGQPETQSRVSYLERPDRYAEDLTSAAELGQKTKDWRKYAEVQRQFLLENLEQTVGPYMPAVQKGLKQDILESVEKDISGFKDFYGSEAYKKALENRPLLSETIDTWEKQPGPQAQKVLREAYELVWDSANARKIPDILQQQKQPSTTQPRMPMSNSQLTPQSTPNTNNKPGMDSSEGRKAIIANLESKGVKDFRF